eukprot:2663600-Rhodomonas_salina.1
MGGLFCRGVSRARVSAASWQVGAHSTGIICKSLLQLPCPNLVPSAKVSGFQVAGKVLICKFKAENGKPCQECEDEKQPLRRHV